MDFDSDIDGHIVRIGEGGYASYGASPKKLLLAGLAGCTGLDVIEILKKMRQRVTLFDIRIEAEQTDTHPKVYTIIRMVYSFSGENLKMEKLEQAVRLSQEKYCGVTAMLKNHCPVEYRIELRSPEADE